MTVRAAVLKALPPSADGSVSLADFGESWRETVMPLLDAAPKRGEGESEGETGEAEAGEAEADESSELRRSVARLQRALPELIAAQLCSARHALRTDDACLAHSP